MERFNRRIDHRKFREELEKRTFDYLETNSLKYFGSTSSIRYNIKLSDKSSVNDFISSKSPVFDGMVQNINGVYFIEVLFLSNPSISIMYFERFYYMLNKVILFSKRNNVPSSLLLVLRYVDEKLTPVVKQRFYRDFDYALESGLLRIEWLKVDENELNEFIMSD
ncbi:hypothetical protein HF295_02610 [Hujiaoplasma nucleasis]|uniref:Uncharacterized protein n=1 Tax=Hujiaoplasma nucleasis TaxID=2725268 RepID=A0A7L6N5G0_9MOLU|nr:hypothetical protein [Hujiaoplasma nucleasis]QLY39809.1 hypothetical protein HF295_02610 [Hujiaoplasma nucleasis]